MREICSNFENILYIVLVFQVLNLRLRKCWLGFAGIIDWYKL